MLGGGATSYATWVGYKKDGSQLIACGPMDPIFAPGAEKGSTCYVNAGGDTRRLTLTQSGQHWVVGPELGAVIHALDEGVGHEFAPSGPMGTMTPPAVTASWPYAADLALEVTTVAATHGSGQLKVGGRYGREEPVFPITLAFRPAANVSAELVWAPSWNAIVVNPANTELGLVGHFTCMASCTELVLARVRYDEIASLVYNDTGFRHHQRKEYAASRDLFLKATWANPRAPLPPYNLACAYAQLGDAPGAEKALKLAIAVGGDKVKGRAKADADFANVLGAPWFKALTD